MRQSNLLVLASTNSHKLQEFKQLLRPFTDLEVVPPTGLIRNAEKIGMVEKFKTYSENALAKAQLVQMGCHYPTLADDSGLEVFALDGRPGVLSARYGKQSQNLSQKESTRNNLEKVLQEMKGKTDRRARFVCSLALVIEGITLQADGYLEGSLTESPRGDWGFGYDSIFVPVGADRTLAEMTSEEKNKISHRTRAIEHLIAETKRFNIVFAKP